MYGLVVTVQPAEEPVSLAEAKSHLRVDSDVENTYIFGLIRAARMAIEARLRRVLVTQSLKLTLDRFPGCDGTILLPRSPAQSITSIIYTDDAGASQTLLSTKYKLDAQSLVPRVMPAYAEIWPTTRAEMNAVAVTYVGGYGLAVAVPEPIKQAIKLLVGTYFDTVRETVVIGDSPSLIPHAVDYLIGPYRVPIDVGAE
jgi:uncharacterized phiE125 gp8 family phage protein